jgi:hypothetical protein
MMDIIKFIICWSLISEFLLLKTFSVRFTKNPTLIYFEYVMQKKKKTSVGF